MSPQIENSAKAIVVEDDKVLLLRYVDSSYGLGTWYSLPGGRQRYGETLAEALVRECREEVGVTVRVGDLLFTREYIHSRHELRGKGRDQHKIEFMFRCSLAEALVREGSGDGADVDQMSVEWCSLDDMSELNLMPSPLRRLKELLADRPGDAYWGDVY